MDIELLGATTEKNVTELIQSFIRPFDLSEAPLIRVGVIPVMIGRSKTPKYHLLLVDMHHIISDGVSENILARDFIKLYCGEELTPLKIQYKDYAHWQLEKSQQDLLEKQKQFWLTEFEEDPLQLSLPLDFDKPLVKDYTGESIQFSLESEKVSALRQLSDSEGATMYMVILAIYNVLLSKLSNTEDIVIGTPVAGRSHIDLEDVMGMFVNTLAIRNQPKGELTFQDFLKNVQQKMISCYDNQNYPYEALIDQLDIDRSSGQNPLFDVMFTFQNIEEEELSISGLDISPYETDIKISKFDMTLAAYESSNQLILDLEYSSQLFKRATIEKFIKYFESIIDQIIGQVDIKLSSIEILSKKDREKILKTFNAEKATFPSNKLIHQIFEEQAALYPDKIAVELGADNITYDQLNKRSNQLARLLRNNGVEADSIVGVLMDRFINTIVSMIGVLKAGGAYLPIDVDYPQSRIDYMINDSGLEVLIAEDEYTFDGNTINLTKEDLNLFDDSNLEHISNAHHLSYIIYTSGTTGQPKGVMVEHRNVISLLFNDKSQFDFDENDVWTMFHSHCFDFSVWEMYGALLFGGKLIIIPKVESRDPLAFLKILVDKRVTVLNQTPSAFYNLISADMESEESLLNLRYVIFGGEALRPIKLSSWIHKYPENQTSKHVWDHRNYCTCYL